MNVQVISKANSLAEEKEVRLALLHSFGVDTEGFGLLNIFFVSDEIILGLDWLPRKLVELRKYDWASKFSAVSVSQFKTRNLEIRQTITVCRQTSTYKQDCWIHDQDPIEARRYVINKYNLTLA